MAKSLQLYSVFYEHTLIKRYRYADTDMIQRKYVYIAPLKALKSPGCVQISLEWNWATLWLSLAFIHLHSFLVFWIWIQVNECVSQQNTYTLQCVGTRRVLEHWRHINSKYSPSCSSTSIKVVSFISCVPRFNCAHLEVLVFSKSVWPTAQLL